jgi:hypothetical protein
VGQKKTNMPASGAYGVARVSSRARGSIIALGRLVEPQFAPTDAF